MVLDILANARQAVRKDYNFTIFHYLSMLFDDCSKIYPTWSSGNHAYISEFRCGRSLIVTESSRSPCKMYQLEDTEEFLAY